MLEPQIDNDSCPSGWAKRKSDSICPFLRPLFLQLDSGYTPFTARLATPRLYRARRADAQARLRLARGLEARSTLSPRWRVPVARAGPKACRGTGAGVENRRVWRPRYRGEPCPA